MNPRHFSSKIRYTLVFGFLFFIRTLYAQEAVRSALSGALLLHGGGDLQYSIVQEFLALGKRKESGKTPQLRLVLIPSASTDADDPQDQVEYLQLWKDRGASEVQILHTRSREEANTLPFVECLQKATAVWIGGGDQALLEEVYRGTRVEEELHRLLARGGVIGGISAGTAIASDLMIREGVETPVLGKGFALLPYAIVDQHFVARQRSLRLEKALLTAPRMVGYGVDEDTALVVQGRILSVLGDSSVTVCLAPSLTKPAYTLVLKAGDSADILALERAALARSQNLFSSPFPEASLSQTKGTLFLGGGALSLSSLQHFVQAFPDPQGILIVIPSASETPEALGIQEQILFHKAGVSTIKIVHARQRSESFDPAFLEVFQSAQAVWFSGGRQWRLVDLYLGTPVEQALHQILAQGGVLGGDSAGASILAEYLVRGNPLGNEEIMAEGYEQGFALLRGAAIDQHFSQRQRFGDMEALKKTFPSLLGIGIDEGSCVLLQGSQLRVLGENAVYLYPQNTALQSPPFVKLTSGESYSLASSKKKSSSPQLGESEK